MKDWFKTLRWGSFKVPGGWCAAAWTSQGLSALVLPQPSAKEALRRLHEYLPPLPPETLDQPPLKVPPDVQTQVLRALKGKPFRFSKVDIPFLTPFQQRILKATCGIPWGQVRTYGWVAQRARTRGFRAVGQALNRNPVSLLIPCHRVIASGNRLGGYGGNVDWKIRLLQNEGIAVKNQRIIMTIGNIP